MLQSGILVERVQNAKEEYIKSAYDAMAEKFGSFDNFVENGLGITREEIESFKNYILE